jgi:hypothetical protein
MAANSGDHDRIVAVPNDASMLGPHTTFFTSPHLHISTSNFASLHLHHAGLLPLTSSCLYSHSIAMLILTAARYLVTCSRFISPLAIHRQPHQHVTMHVWEQTASHRTGANSTLLGAAAQRRELWNAPNPVLFASNPVIAFRTMPTCETGIAIVFKAARSSLQLHGDSVAPARRW